jgi:hypothetical protein
MQNLKRFIENKNQEFFEGGRLRLEQYLDDFPNFYIQTARYWGYLPQLIVIDPN